MCIELVSLGKCSLCVVFDGGQHSICFVGIGIVWEFADCVSSTLHDFFGIEMKVVKFFAEMYLKEMFAGGFW